MTDTPAAAGTLIERLREYAADCDEGIVSDYETPGLLAREAADELSACRAELAASQEECLATFNLAAEQQARAEQSERLLAAAERDAARYRWLRMRHWNDSALCVVVEPKENAKLGSYCPSEEQLDEAIDAALSSKESPK